MRTRQEMDSVEGENVRLRGQVDALRAELAAAHAQLALPSQSQSQQAPPTCDAVAHDDTAQTVDEQETKQPGGWKWELSEDAYERYSRQLIVPGMGVKGLSPSPSHFSLPLSLLLATLTHTTHPPTQPAGQLKLQNAKVLIVGAGGLGCPAATYLAGAGIGTIGIIDGDVVEISNLHRQIAHATSRVGQPKVTSLITHLRSLNPLPTYIAHETFLSTANALDVVSRYDVVLDCTDRPSTRYLVSDAAVLLRKPLVSASALRTDGQLLVLNSPAKPAGDATGAPCYRCVFPRPPPAETVQGCGEGGVLGMAVAVMGVLQALETVKILTGIGTEGKEEEHGAENANERTSMTMLLFSGTRTPMFRSVRMSGRRRAGCVACSGAANLSLDGFRDGSVDYDAFCGVVLPVRLLAEDERVTASCLADVMERSRSHVLLDVRDPAHFAVCCLPGAINVPAGKFLRQRRAADGTAEEDDWWWLPTHAGKDDPVYVVCRVGNDSQTVARRLIDGAGGRKVWDVKGGMKAWKDEVDKTLPFT